VAISYTISKDVADIPRMSQIARWVDRARPLRAGRQQVVRPAPRQDRISVPVKIGNPIGSDSPAYLALTAADADICPKLADS
jgi:hypothetical protein